MRKPSTPWTDKEINFLKKNYNTMENDSQLKHFLDGLIAKNMTHKPYTTKQLASKLGITIRGVQKNIERGKYPNAYQCDCEQHSWLIPQSDVNKSQDK